ncbi:MAG: DNA-binding protein [Desulfobulbaceae bacterium]|nr:DNA-binding protein [Desulfobulbaceae bacterium]
MKYTYCIPAVLAMALLFTGPTLAEEKKPAASAAAPSVSMDGKPIKGKVLETMDTGGYTYIQVDAPEGKIWVAIPQSKIEVGQEIMANPGMAMADFESKTLNKTFDVIIFSSGLGDPSKPFNPEKKAAMGGMGGSSFAAAMQAESGGVNPHGNTGGAMGGAAMAEPSGGSTTAIVPAAEVKVDKATGENAQTIGECFDKAKELDNKKVQVRGKVMKVSRMIMGKNWLHLQDGTGNPMKNTHDLVVTTMAVPEKDSVVIIEGILHADKDFGAGYKYDVIIEDAEVR